LKAGKHLFDVLFAPRLLLWNWRENIAEREEIRIEKNWCLVRASLVEGIDCVIGSLVKPTLINYSSPFYEFDLIILGVGACMCHKPRFLLLLHILSISYHNPYAINASKNVLISFNSLFLSTRFFFFLCEKKFNVTAN